METGRGYTCRGCVRDCSPAARPKLGASLPFWDAYRQRGAPLGLDRPPPGALIRHPDERTASSPTPHPYPQYWAVPAAPLVGDPRLSWVLGRRSFFEPEISAGWGSCVFCSLHTPAWSPAPAGFRL